METNGGHLMELVWLPLRGALPCLTHNFYKLKERERERGSEEREREREGRERERRGSSGFMNIT